MKTILSISVSPDVRAALDAERSRQRRSRSFVVEEAIRDYLAARDSSAFAEGRSRTIREALALSAKERVQLSEDLWRELAPGHKVAKPWTATFDTFAEYERWRRDPHSQDPA